MNPHLIRRITIAVVVASVLTAAALTVAAGELTAVSVSPLILVVIADAVRIHTACPEDN